MKISLYCQNCGGHLRQGSHKKCKVILRRQRESEKVSRSATKTSDKHSQEYLAKLGDR